MAREFLCVYHDMLPALKNLGSAEVGRLILAALEYDISDKQPTDLIGKEAILWPMLMSQIDRNKAHYKKICETNRDNVTKRYDRIRSNASVYDGIQENRIEQNKTEKNRTEQKRVVKRFAPPTLDEVKAYVTEKGLGVDPVKFFDYFTEGNWIDSKGNPVRNWKQKLLTWANKEPAPALAKKKQYTTEEDYAPPKPKLTVEQINALVDRI